MRQTVIKLFLLLIIAIVADDERLISVLAETCPKTFGRGNISHWCDREPNDSCGFECNEDCYPAFTYLTCHENGYWTDADKACICSDSKDPSICPTTIPNGKLSPDCRRSPLSYCTFMCDDNCFATRRHIVCNDFGYTARWEFGNEACSCPETTRPTTQVIEAGEKESSSFTVTVVVAVMCGVIVPVIIVLGIAFFIIKRSRASTFTPTPTTAETAAPAYNETMRHMNTSQNGQFTSVRAQNISRSDIRSSSPVNLNVNTRVNSNVNTHVNTHNSSGHVPVNTSVSVPMTPPPSYEEVRAHPLDFSKKDDV